VLLRLSYAHEDTQRDVQCSTRIVGSRHVLESFAAAHMLPDCGSDTRKRVCDIGTCCCAGLVRTYLIVVPSTTKLRHKATGTEPTCKLLHLGRAVVPCAHSLAYVVATAHALNLCCSLEFNCYRLRARLTTNGACASDHTRTIFSIFLCFRCAILRCRISFLRRSSSTSATWGTARRRSHRCGRRKTRRCEKRATHLLLK